MKYYEHAAYKDHKRIWPAVAAVALSALPLVATAGCVGSNPYLQPRTASSANLASERAAQQQADDARATQQQQAFEALKKRGYLTQADVVRVEPYETGNEWSATAILSGAYENAFDTLSTGFASRDVAGVCAAAIAKVLANGGHISLASTTGHCVVPVS